MVIGADGAHSRVARAVEADRYNDKPVVGGGVANLFRRPFGPGWALVGDAGYLKDSVTAQGISDAFLDAELCVTALESTFDGSRSFDDAMAEYQYRRDTRVLPIYEFTTGIASLGPPPPELREVLGAIDGDRQAMNEFATLFAGTISPTDFFDPANLDRLTTSVA